MAGNPLDITGFRFGRLLAIKRAPNNPFRPSPIKWICRCDCGVMKEVIIGNLRAGHTNSCGCLQSESIRKTAFRHGLDVKTKEYFAWAGMNTRYPHLVCDAWRDSYSDFLKDVGNAPTKNHRMVRIDRAKKYGPGNAEWRFPKTKVTE